MGSRFSRIGFPHHPRPQTIAPATASKMKWFAVATMAIRIVNGYAKPILRHAKRRQEGRLSVNLEKNGNATARERRCWGASGIVIIVNPIIKA